MSDRRNIVRQHATKAHLNGPESPNAIAVSKREKAIERKRKSMAHLAPISLTTESVPLMPVANRNSA